MSWMRRLASHLVAYCDGVQYDPLRLPPPKLALNQLDVMQLQHQTACVVRPTLVCSSRSLRHLLHSRDARWQPHEAKLALCPTALIQLVRTHKSVLLLLAWISFIINPHNKHHDPCHRLHPCVPLVRTLRADRHHPTSHYSLTPLLLLCTTISLNGCRMHPSKLR
jgi:hypothetical protein